MKGNRLVGGPRRARWSPPGRPAARACRELKYVVIVSRHGVRSPTWETARLNQYSAEPWPEWDVPPGNLTPHGRKLIELMGSYYRDWLAGEHLLQPGMRGRRHIFIRADKDQRTLETGAPSRNRCCPVAEFQSTLSRRARPILCSQAPGPRSQTGAHGRARPPRPRSAEASRRPPRGFGCPAVHTQWRARCTAAMGVSAKGKSVELQGPFATGSTLQRGLTAGIRRRNAGHGSQLGPAGSGKPEPRSGIAFGVCRSDAPYALSRARPRIEPFGARVALDGAGRNRHAGTGRPGPTGRYRAAPSRPRHQFVQPLRDARSSLEPARIPARTTRLPEGR